MSASQDLAQQVSDLLNERRQRLAMLEADKGAAHRDIDQLRAAPLSTDDAWKFVCAYIDRWAEEYASGPAELGVTLGSFARPRRAGEQHPNQLPAPLCLADFDAIANAHPMAFFGSTSGVNILSGSLAGNLASVASQALLFFLFGDVIKQRLRPIFFDAYRAAGDAGPSIDQRRARIAELEERAAELDVEIEAIRAEVDRFVVATDPQIAKADLLRQQQKDSDLRRDRAIYHDANGRNCEELAKRYRVSVAHVKGIAGLGVAPSL